MKISASIYSGDLAHLDQTIEQLKLHGIDYIHIDCMDNPNVVEDIKRINALSTLPVDLHIISSTPEKLYPLLKDTRVDMITLQHEYLRNGFSFPDWFDGARGIAISSETPVEVFDNYIEDSDFVLIMATEPGKSGGRFNRENFRKIRQFRNRYPGFRIHVDGGVNNEVSFILRNMGVFAAVSGSYLMNADSLGLALHRLRMDNSGSHYTVSDFMYERDEIPLLTLAQLSLPRILQTIEDYGMGFVIITKEDGRLYGLITNADIRRGLLKNLDDLNQIKAADLINTSPFVIFEDITVNEMLEAINKIPFPVLYLPVIDHTGRVTGAVKFNNLIKGES